MERRHPNRPVTHGELRAILEPILERHRKGAEAYALYERMVPLGLSELLPEVLAGARTRKVLAELGKGRRSRWIWTFTVIGVIYGAVTAIGSVVGLLFAFGLIR